MSTFKVGDRVRVYGFWLSSGYEADTGSVISLDGEKGLRIKGDAGAQFSAHIKQCRRLRKKEKPLSVEFNARIAADHGVVFIDFSSDDLIPLIGKRVRVTVTEIKP
jgi:hypothetical protein